MLSRRIVGSLSSKCCKLPIKSFSTVINELDSKGNYLKRFITTAEVTVSKIFPAGFGWQYGSIIAGDLGYTATDLSFAALTGLGDCTGVLLGHATYYALKSLASNDIDMKKELSTAVFLGSAAFCSGFAWQPVVNVLQGLDVPFMGVALGAWSVCGASFYVGLRLFRTVYSPLIMVAPGSSKNVVDDAMLSLSIGGAAGGFVGTDAVYQNGDGNFLKPLVGVQPSDAALTACAKAGSATSIGFAAAQSAQNIAYPKFAKNWTD